MKMDLESKYCVQTDNVYLYLLEVNGANYMI
jgi:hypothetical protein